MEMVEGGFFGRHVSAVGYVQRPAYFDAMNDTIARLHLLQYSAVGLGDYGKPGNYFARQIGRWSKQYLRCGRRTRSEHGCAHRMVTANIPVDDQVSLIHGDFRCDNMIFPERAQVLAVLDWELSTIGHPLADLRITDHVRCLGTSLPAVGPISQFNIPSEENT